MHSKPFDCIIVGAGALGSFHAFHALKKGLHVLLLEKDEKPLEATVRNFGQAVPSGMRSGKWQDYGRRSLEIYKAIQSACNISVRQNGTVYLASNPVEQTLIEELATINEKQAYTSQVLDKETCLDKYPGLRASYCIGGLFFPDEVTIEPDQLIYTLLAYLTEQMGLVYKTQQLITSVVSKGDYNEVEAADGTVYRGTKVIVCSGRDFQALYPTLFYKSDIEVSKLQMMRTTPMEGYRLPGSVLGGLSIRRYESLHECPSYEKLHATSIDANFRKWGVHVLFKQAIDGSIIMGDSHEYADARRAGELGFDNKQVINDIILEEAQRMFTLPHWHIATYWNGYYAQRKGHDIFCEEVEPNTWIVTAIGGKGMTGSAGFSEKNIQNIFG